MTQARRRRSQSTDRRLIITGLREILFISLCFLSLYLFVSLISYYPLDPSLFHDNSGITDVHNRGGLAGALLADLFFNLFGYFSYLLAYMVGHLGWLIYKGKHAELLADPKELIVPGFGFLLTLSAGCGLAIVHFAAEGALLPTHAGGWLGNLVGKNLASVISPVGATLLLMAVFLTGITMLTGLSWLKLMDFLGHHTLRLTPIGWRYLRHQVWPWTRQHSVNTWRWSKHKTLSASQATAEFTRDNSQKLKTFRDSFKKSVRSRDVSMAVCATDIEEHLDDLPPAQTDEVSEPAKRGFRAPRLELLAAAEPHEAADLKPIFMRVQVALKKFSSEAKVKNVYPGPLVSRVEINPAQAEGEDVAKLGEQLLEQLGIPGVRILESSPAMLCLELPNPQPHAVYLRELLGSEAFQSADKALPIGLGMDVVGHPVIVDLARMPHVLLTGSNSTDLNRALHGMIVSLLYRTTPDQVKLLLLDSAHKVLQQYADMPHLLTPVQRPDTLRDALQWCNEELEKRYRMMSEVGARNIEGYNRKVGGHEETEEGFQVNASAMPYIVVVTHDLAAAFADENAQVVEDLLTRLAQKARAAGIHMIIASHDPAVHVLTGVIKNNFPTRMVFQVATRNDSHSALGQAGAELLLGNGDMFYLTPGTSSVARLHGAQISSQEVKHIVEFLRKQRRPQYLTI